MKIFKALDIFFFDQFMKSRQKPKKPETLTQKVTFSKLKAITASSILFQQRSQELKLVQSIFGLGKCVSASSGAEVLSLSLPSENSKDQPHTFT